MNLRVPYLVGAAIEASASALLAGHVGRRGGELRPPVPVEDILQDHLRLHLGFDDLRSRLGAPDVMGALWIDRREVIIDQSLDPGEHPSALGRYRFTLGHEVGHWELHRPHFLAQQLQDDLFRKSSSGPSIICRTGQQRERIELQADAFAGALLMPRPEVVAHWHRLIGPERLKVSELCNRGKVFVAAALLGRGRISTEPRAQQNDLIELAIRPMAEAFEVSLQAMRIRLEHLGFIIRDVEGAASLFEAV